MNLFIKSSIITAGIAIIILIVLNSVIIEQDRQLNNCVKLHGNNGNNTRIIVELLQGNLCCYWLDNYTNVKDYVCEETK